MLAPNTGSGRPALMAWALYDWANSPFFAIVLTFVFPTYVAKAVAGDAVAGASAWGWAMAASGLLVALTSPVMGAVADRGGRHLAWLFTFTLLTAVLAASLWWVRPEPAWLLPALLLAGAAALTAELALPFYNALLPRLAPPGAVGRWSGWSWAMGYVAGILALLVLLVFFIRADPPALGLDKASAEPVRIAGPFVALWLLVFAAPLFLLVRGDPATGLPLRQAVTSGLRDLRQTLRRLPERPALSRFLVARLVYNDGLNTLFAMGGIYAAGTFGMATGEVITLGIALNLTAGLGAFAFAWLDDGAGPKATILIGIAGLAIAGIVALLAPGPTLFWVAAMALGIFIGPVQASSRSLMARFTEPERAVELFGLYALTGKITSFLGPALFATATAAIGTQRAGMAIVLVMLVLGGLLLLGVREPLPAARPEPVVRPEPGARR